MIFKVCHLSIKTSKICFVFSYSYSEVKFNLFLSPLQQYKLMRLSTALLSHKAGRAITRQPPKKEFCQLLLWFWRIFLDLPNGFSQFFLLTVWVPSIHHSLIPPAVLVIHSLPGSKAVPWDWLSSEAGVDSGDDDTTLCKQQQYNKPPYAESFIWVKQLLFFQLYLQLLKIKSTTRTATAWKAGRVGRHWVTYILRKLSLAVKQNRAALMYWNKNITGTGVFLLKEEEFPI